MGKRKMSKLVLVETISTFRHTYVVRLPDNEPVEYALDDVVSGMNNVDADITDVTQNHIAEDIFSHRVITEKEYLEMFDRENAYLSGWPTDKKLEFIYDSLEHREKQVYEDVNLSEGC
jgi:hypothetical protein